MEWQTDVQSIYKIDALFLGAEKIAFPCFYISVFGA